MVLKRLLKKVLSQIIIGLLLINYDLPLSLGACPTNWQLLDGTCIGLVNKAGNSPFANAAEARKECQLYGADLASIPDNATQVAMLNMLQAASEDRAYIGGTDIEEEGVFRWLDNTTFSYENWKSGEPNNTSFWSEENCMIITAELGESWHDYTCCIENNVTEVVCSKPENSNVTIGHDILHDKCYGDCPTGWYRNKNKCYEVFDVTGSSISSFYDARQYCLNKKADLLDIKDINEAKHAAHFMRHKGVTFPWIPLGLNDLVADGDFVHLDGTVLNTTAVDFWQGATPGGGGTNCIKWVHTNPATDPWTLSVEANFNDFQWNMTFCCNTSVDYVMCEKPMTSNISLTPDDDVLAVECYGHLDECSPDPCVQGSCADKVLGYNCTCNLGYNGTNCDNLINYCSSIPCMNNGTCNGFVGGYSCACIAGITGSNCETIEDQCLSSPCQHGGTCVDGTDSYTCNCVAGYGDTNCQTDINDCANVTCQNGGNCVDKLNDFNCDCVGNFAGTYCELNVSCPLITSIVNANISGSGTTLDTVTTVSCLTKHKFPDMTRIKYTKCQETNLWNDTSYTPGCDVHCDYVPDISNAYRNTNNSLHDTYVNYTCYHGYIFTDNSTEKNITCMADGEWDSDISQMSDCEKVRCPELPEWPYTQTDTMNNTFDTIVTFSCDVGFSFHDNTTARTIKCLASGKWTASPPACQAIQCPELQDIALGMKNSSNNTYDSFVEYSCTGTNRMIDGSRYRVLKCDATAEWSDSVTDCAADRCYPLPYVANAEPSTLVALHGTTSTLSCVLGYQYPDTPSYTDKEVLNTTCNNNGRWLPLLPSCVPKLCPPQPTANHTTPSTYERIYPTVVDFTCDKGHYYPDDSSVISIWCQADKTWNFTNIPNCYPIYCDPPPVVYNGTWNLPPSNVYESLVSYDCDTNFKFWDGRRSRSIMCNEFGEWNESDVSCRRDRCDEVPLAANVVPDTFNTSWYTLVTYGCETGYEWLNGKTKHITYCSNMGYWNDTSVPKCNIKECSAVPNVWNAYASTTAHVYDTYVNQTCNIGHKYPDNDTDKQMWCNSNAQWEPAIFPGCQIINCPDLLEVENATALSSNTQYDSEVYFECLPGFQYPDRTLNRTITCQANETWTEYPPPCETVHCPALPKWDDMSFNTSDTDFLAVALYTCDAEFAFEDKTNSKTTVCQEDKSWKPEIEPCIELKSIGADLIGQAWDAPKAIPIGTMCVSVMGVILGGLILLDLRKIFLDLIQMKSDVSSMIRSYQYSKMESTC